MSRSGKPLPRASAPKPSARRDFRLPASKSRALRKLFPGTATNQPKLFNLYIAIVDSVRKELVKIDPTTDRYELLTPARRIVVLIDNFEGQVRNGGFEQYYDNPSGDGAALVPAALRAVKQPKVAQIVERANAQFRAGPPRDGAKRMAALDKLGARARTAWEKAETAFFNLPLPLNGLGLTAVVPFILKHEAEFFKPN